MLYFINDSFKTIHKFEFHIFLREKEVYQMLHTNKYCIFIIVTLPRHNCNLTGEFAANRSITIPFGHFFLKIKSLVELLFVLLFCLSLCQM